MESATNLIFVVLVAIVVIYLVVRVFIMDSFYKNKLKNYEDEINTLNTRVDIISKQLGNIIKKED